MKFSEIIDRFCKASKASKEISNATVACSRLQKGAATACRDSPILSESVRSLNGASEDTLATEASPEAATAHCKKSASPIGATWQKVWHSCLGLGCIPSQSSSTESSFGSGSDSSATATLKPASNCAPKPFACADDGSTTAKREADLPVCTVIKRLGKGAQGTVDLVRLELDGKDIMAARKLVKQFPGAFADVSEDMYKRELLGLRAGAGSPHVCQLLASSATSTPGHLTFIFEYFKRDLDNVLRTARRASREPGMLVSEDNLSVIGASLLLGLRDLHSKGCVHRDLKPANIFVSSEGRVAIGDFDNSEFVDTAGAVYGTAGTQPYQAPEIPRSFEVEKEQPYSMPADIYSLGVVLSECAMGCDWIRWQGYLSGTTREVPSFIPATLVSLLEGLLERDPTKRLTVEGAMRHPFFAMIDFENDI